MGKGVKIPLVRGLKYHGQGGQNTMGKGVKIPWVGGSIYTMVRGFVISWIWVQYTMGRGSKYHR